jgi:autotransporter-associated beta strand protein
MNATVRFWGALGTSLLLQAAAVPALKATPTNTTYTATWASVDTHNPAPEWFQDAKFGIYFHWGIFSVPAHYNEWYPRWSQWSNDTTGCYTYQTNTYGYPAMSGPPNPIFPYQYFINGGTNKAGQFVQFAPKPVSAGGSFDPNAWAAIFADAGAQFAGPMAEHHDGFSMWASKVNPWNAVSKGPQQDLVSELVTAIRAKNLKIVLSLHHAYNFEGYWQYAPLQTDTNLQQLYGQLPSTQEYTLWQEKLQEVIDGYQPDIIWQDFDLAGIPQAYRLNFLSYYYNSALDWGKEVVATYKNNDFDTSGEVLDYERGGPADVLYPYWLTDESVSGFTWGYTSGMSLYSIPQLVDELIDRVSKGGNFLLSCAPMANGVIPAAQTNLLHGIGVWLKQNGEAIYSTRAWVVGGEGPSVLGGPNFNGPVVGTSADIRFTRNKATNVLYAIFMAWPGNGAQEKITTLSSVNINLNTLTNVQLFGATAGTYISLAYTQDASGLNVTMPSSQPYTATAYALKLSFSGTIPPVGNITSPPANSLIWKGDGSANAWNTSMANWTSNGTAKAYANGNAVAFDDSSANTTVNLSGTLSPASVNVGATESYSFNGSGSIAGGATLTKSGVGALTINNTNTFTGGISVSGGTIALGNIGANSSGLGGGAITFMGGGLQFYGYGSTSDSGGCSDPLVVPTGQTGTLLLPGRFGYSAPFTSALSGGGTLNVTVDYIRQYFSGNWSAFTGQISLSPRSGTGDFRINNVNGYASAAIYLNSGVNFYNINASGQTTDIGELGGASGAYIGSGSSSSSNPTWRIGAKNTTNTYAGVIADAGTTSLTKIGTGTLILTGANTYSGNTTISGGRLIVNNSIGSGTGYGAVTVVSGGVLGGGGIISGATTVNSGGTLSFSNLLTLNSGSTNIFEISKSPLTNDAARVLGVLTCGGTLIVTNIGATALAAGDSFKLFNAASYGGVFAKMVLPPLPAGLGWNTNALNTAGALSVIVVTRPVFGLAGISGGGVVFSGAAGVAKANFYLLGSTNLAVPVTDWTRLLTNQFDTNGNFNFTNPFANNPPPGFFRLQLQ